MVDLCWVAHPERAATSPSPRPDGACHPHALPPLGNLPPVAESARVVYDRGVGACHLRLAPHPDLSTQSTRIHDGPRRARSVPKILETPSPSGYERPLQDLVREYVGRYADEVSTDVHGNVIAVRNPGAPVRVMLAGHCDQIGLIVQHVDDNGFVYVQQIGGWDPLMLIGQRMKVWTAAGPVFGVIARKPIHLLTDEEKAKVPKLKDLWLDIGAANKEEAPEARPRRRPDHRRTRIPRGGQPLRRRAGHGRQDRRLGRPRGPPPRVEGESRLRALRRLDRPGGSRPARRQDQRLRRRSARRHRRGRHLLDRLPHDRKEGRGRHQPRQGARHLSRTRTSTPRSSSGSSTPPTPPRSRTSWPPPAARREPTPTRCRSAARAWPPAW